MKILKKAAAAQATQTLQSAQTVQSPRFKKSRLAEITGLCVMLLGLLLILHPLSAMVLDSWAARGDYARFAQKQAAATASFKQNLLREAEHYNEALKQPGQAVIDPFGVTDYSVKYPMSLDPDEPFAYLRIPAIDVSMPIYLGASAEHLDLGAAHVDGTNLPSGGQSSRAVVAAHRMHYSGLMFFNLDMLEQGDDVYIDVLGMELRYKVFSQEDIHPNEPEKLSPIAGKDILTLLTCTPKYGTRYLRLLVHCERVLPKPAQSAPAGSSEPAIPSAPSEASVTAPPSVPSEPFVEVAASERASVKLFNRFILILAIVGWLAVLGLLFKLIQKLRRN